MTRFVRISHGNSFHERDCQVVRRSNPANVLPWHWGEGKTRKELVSLLNQPKLYVQPCKVCKPLEGLE